MLQREVKINNIKGFHARPATQFVKVANTFESSVQLLVGDEKVDAKSVISIIALALPVDCIVTIITDGPDEAEALDALANIIESEKYE